VEDFRQVLSRLREEKGWSLRHLANQSGVDWSHIGRIERGGAGCSLDTAQWLDTALGADGKLLEAHPDTGLRQGQAKESDAMRRRTAIGTMTGLALGAIASPAVALEALRHDLAGMLANGADISEWEAIAWTYGSTYGSTPPAVLLETLRVDLQVACAKVASLPDESSAQRSMQRVVALLAAFMAQTLGNLGDDQAALRWWRTARTYADASQEPQARVWVRGREVIRGMYERRPLTSLLAIAEEADLISDQVGIGTCAALAGRAQILSMLGRTSDAKAALDRVRDAASRLPADVWGDTESMYGWPEYRLRHTESYTYTYLGAELEAETAHDRAMELYPQGMFRERAQVELHRALRLVRAGDTAGGADHAQRVVQSLPSDQRIAAVLGLARTVVDKTPPAEQNRPQVAGLREMLALPAAG
jgi:transcriptional regulator with XRE-family HTH domain